jgi:benzodiazapine receptor
MSARAAIIPFLLLVVGGGMLIGFLTTPGPWYEALAKPPFNPPNWLFGPVWTILYVFIAVAGWRIWRQDRKGTPMKLWWLQLVLNFLWSPTFFAMQQVGLALIVVLAMLATILAFIAAAWNVDRLSAWLFVPYAAWVAFATLLNASIWLLN